MTCICCCKDKDKYLEELAKEFGSDVVQWYKDKSVSYKLRPYSYFDKSDEALNFGNRNLKFYLRLQEDQKNFCKRKSCYSESQ